MTIKKCLFIVLIFGSSLGMANENEKKPKGAAAPASAQSDSEQTENAVATDPWMDQEPNKSMWDKYFRDKKLKEEERIRDQELAEAEQAGKERVVGGAGPSGSED